MRESFKGRLNLTEKASQALLFMVQQLKEENPHLQVNVSRLCSWIIENYVREHFSKETPRIVEAHFNPKRYVTEMIKKAKSEDEIKEIFQDVALKLKGRPIVQTPKKAPTKTKSKPETVDPAGTKAPDSTVQKVD